MSARPVDVRDLVDYLDHFQRRCLQEAMAQATKSWWLRRAEEFLAARPQLGEMHGERTPEQLRAKWRELTDVANACRARAEVALVTEAEEVASWHAA